MARAKLALLARARQDMIDIRRYSLREFGRAAADRYVEDIRGVFELLRDNPAAGAALSAVGPDIRSFSKRAHRIVYRIRGETVEIVRVLHHSRDFSKHLGG